MHLTFTTTAAIGLVSLVGGCSLLTPEDKSPRIEQFTASPQSAKLNEPVTFSLKASDDIGLEDIVVALPDTTYTFKPQGQRFFETAFQRAYNAPGVKQGTATATDAKRQALPLSSFQLLMLCLLSSRTSHSMEQKVTL
jgi:hypothetical protein